MLNFASIVAPRPVWSARLFVAAFHPPQTSLSRARGPALFERCMVDRGLLTGDDGQVRRRDSCIRGYAMVQSRSTLNAPPTTEEETVGDGGEKLVCGSDIVPYAALMTHTAGKM